LSPARKPRFSLRSLALRSLTVAVGCLGLFWGIFSAAQGEVSDGLWDIEARLLRFDAFSHATSVAMLESTAALDLNPCDNHSQRALMLMEIPLADTALRSGAMQEYDRRTHALETRARLALGCTPRDSFIWLLLFGMQTEHGILDERAFDLLAMSYETSPNEAWIALRRVVVAIPVVRVAPEPIQAKVFAEFQNLVAHGFVETPARAYLGASASTRALLQPRIDQLDPRSQKTFAETLRKLRS
jgi:hypothetical protein